MSPTPLTLTPQHQAEEAAYDGSEFSLDLRVVEAAVPLAKLLCDTSDNCGSTCSGSACNTAANDPF